MRKVRSAAIMFGAMLLVAAAPARATTYTLTAGQQAVGAIAQATTARGDTLLDLARREDVGYTQLVVANPGIDPWLPGAGRKVLVPRLYLLPAAPHRGIVVNLAAERLFYFPPGGRSVQTFPIGIGAAAHETPVAATRVVAKQVAPTWYPPASIRAEEPALRAAIAPGPDNPLGHYALFLGWPGYLIHGTNKPDGVGRHVSHGCVHLYPEDIRRLFAETPVGTPVTVVDQPIGLGWIGGELYLAVYPSRAQAQALEEGQRATPKPPPNLDDRVRAAAGDELWRIDWREVERAGKARNGIPVQISIPAALLPHGTAPSTGKGSAAKGS